MLSEHQIELIIRKVNNDVDIPLLGENREGMIIGKLIREINHHLEPSLNALCGVVYTNALKTALNESIAPKQRSREVTALLQGEMSEPLAKELTARSNALNFLGPRHETSVMKLVSNKIIEESVEWIVEKVEEVHEGLLMSPPPPSHGAVSASATSRGVPGTSTTEASMLSERQIQQIIKKVNEDVDLPLMAENREGKIIEKAVRHLVIHMGPSLNVICGSVYTKAITTALNESMPNKQRSKEVAMLLQGELTAPLATKLTERSDIQKFIGLRLEGAVMKAISEKIIEEFVEWTIVKVDEKN